MVVSPRASGINGGIGMKIDEREGQAEEGLVEVERSLSNARLLEPILHAQKVTGKSILTITSEILRLSIGKSKISPAEYFKYNLFGKGDDEKAEFIGVKRSTAINMRTNCASQLSHLTNNKFLFESLLRGLGIVTTQTQAIFCSPEKHPLLGAIQLLHTENDLRNFLLHASFPIFAKPLVSYQSLGSVGIAGFDEVESKIFLTSGKALTLSAFHDQTLKRYRYSGYAFQEMVKMHPDLAEFTNGAVGTFRVVTTASPKGILILYAAWKIPGKGSMADNFWREGNMLANVDVDSGEVLRCQKSTGLDALLVDSDPETGRNIVGLKIPFWGSVKEMALQVASIIPDERVLGFDVALSSDGPTLIEANTNPDHGIYQIANDKGLWSVENAELLEWNIKMAKKRKKEIKSDALKDYRAYQAREKANTKQGFLSDTSLVLDRVTAKNT